MATRTVLVTPRGRAIYPKLHKPDTKFDADGVYSVKLAISKQDAEASGMKVPEETLKELGLKNKPSLIEVLDAYHKKQMDDSEEEYQAALKKKTRNLKREADLPYSDNPDNEDEIIVNCKMKASGLTKKKEAFTQHPALFDAKGKPMPKDSNVGGGSILRVSFEPNPYFTSQLGSGVSLRLKAVQVIELKSFGDRSASGYGFEAEDGFEADPEESNDFSNGDEKSSGDETKATGSDF